jgi:hypothetical protein
MEHMKIEKVIGADLGRIVARRDAHTYVLLLGGERLRSDLSSLRDGEQVILDEGDLQISGSVYSEVHDGERFWYAVVQDVS